MSEPQQGQKRSRENANETPESAINKFGPPLDTISRRIDAEEVCQRLRKEVIKLAFGNDHMGRDNAPYNRLPGPLPAPVFRKNLDSIQRDPENYWATVKLDGMRFMMYITIRGTYLIDREFRFRKLTYGSFYCKTLCSKLKDTLVDGELIWDKQGKMKYMMFDCLVYMGNSCVDHPLSQRLACVQELASVCFDKDEQRNKTNLPIYAKRMVKATNTLRLFSKMEKLADGYVYRDHDCAGTEVGFGDEEKNEKEGADYMTTADGLVFMREDASCGYHFKPRNSLLKWKLIHTVDVLAKMSTARVSPASADGSVLVVDTFHYGDRFTGVVDFEAVEVKKEDWDRIVEERLAIIENDRGPNATTGAPKKKQKVADEDNHEDTVCLECAFESHDQSTGLQDGKWVVERGRPEKTKPNAKRTIQQTLQVIEEGLNEAALRQVLGTKAPSGSSVAPPPRQSSSSSSQPPRAAPVSAGGGAKASQAPKAPPDILLRMSESVFQMSFVLKDLIEDWKKDPDMELEGRILQRKETVTKEMFDRIVAKLAKDPNYAKHEVNTRDFFFDNGIRVTTGDVKEAIRKQSGNRCDMSLGGSSWALRISLKRESIIPIPEHFEDMTPTLVRVKRRIRFLYKKKWAFDVTMVRQAKSESELNRQEAQQNERWTYELELEAMRVDANLKHSRTMLAQEMIMKLVFCYLEMDPRRVVAEQTFGNNIF